MRIYNIPSFQRVRTETDDPSGTSASPYWSMTFDKRANQGCLAVSPIMPGSQYLHVFTGFSRYRVTVLESTSGTNIIAEKAYSHDEGCREMALGQFRGLLWQYGPGYHNICCLSFISDKDEGPDDLARAATLSDGFEAEGVWSAIMFHGHD